MVLGIRSKSRKSVSTQVNYTIHVQEINPWPPSQSLRSAKSLFLQWENGDQNSGSLNSSAGDGKIEFNEAFNLSVLLWREASKKEKHRENFQKNCLEFHLYDKNVKSQLLGSATINLADFGTIKETKAISIPLNCKKSFRSSTQPFLYVTIQPFDIECSSSSPNSNLSKELSLDKEESESVSQSLKDDDDIAIASFTDDEDDDIPSNASQTIRSAAEITRDSAKISERETKRSNGQFVLPSESTTSSSLGNTKVEASPEANGIKSPSSSAVLYSNMGNAANDRSSLHKISKESVKADVASSEVRERIQQSRGTNITKGGTPKVISPASFISSSMKPNFERSSQSQMTPENSMILEDSSQDQIYNKDYTEQVSSVFNTGVMEEKEKKDVRRKEREQFTMRSKSNFERSSRSQMTPDNSMTQEDSSKDQIYNKDCTEKVSSVSNTGVMEEKEKKDMRRKGRQQFTMRNDISENDLVNNFSDDDSTMKEKLNSAALLRRKKSHVRPTKVLVNDNAEDVRNKSTLKSSESYGQVSRTQTLDHEAKDVNDLNSIHLGTASHENNKVTGSFINGNTELKAEVERLREELREAAALEASMYSVIAEHGSSSNKVHAPARRLSRFYFHSCRVGSPATIASAAQSAVSGFVLVSKACGNDVPRLTFWFSNLILLRAIVSKGVENKYLGDGPCINSEYDENAENHLHSWQDPKTFLVALEKVEAWIFSRIVESVWWQTLTPYMQSAAAKSSSSRKIYGKRFHIGDQDQGSFSIDLWKRAFKDACDRLCPLRAGGHECGCLPVIARSVMEQLVNRLDVAMFNAILRESAEEMPTDPISDPISDSKVLPIPAGKSSFGAGAQLKNAIGDWSRWLSDLQKQTQLLSLEDHIEPANTGTGGIGIPSDYFGLDASAANVGGKSGRRFSSLSEFPLKICHYFNKGYCKHGTNCRYYHGHVLPENFSQMYGNDTNSEDQVFSQGSLAQLESEIIELLKQKRGHPMSIASLPMAYYDRYKKVLQADGYLTESQRHGKSGYNLTKLLEQLNGSIRLISRPHGQHAVVLAEDAPKYIREGDSAQNISASRQIYLTFPADSTFTEEDVSDYFNTFGCVEDVRIPCQQRRMFGFVTFADPETVKMILEKGNPHYVRGSRVLVKPYKEKAKTLERKYGDRGEHSVYCSPHYVDLDSELDSMPISTGNHRSIRRQLIEEQEQALEFQRRRLAQLQFLQQPLSTSPHFGVSIDELRVPDDNFNLQPSESLSSAPNDRPKQADTDSSDENSHQGFDLPDSPFSFANI